MRILLVSDLHYTLKQLDWVASVAGDYDLVVVAGDHLDIASIVEPDAQIAVVLEYLSRIATKTTVVACSGNHDLNARNEHGERSARWLEAARGSGVFVDGTSFANERELVTVCPWWDGPLTREVVDRQLADDAALVGDRRWIWVYHAPPDASPTSWTGQAALRRRGSRRVDRAAPTRHRAVRARAPVAVRAGRRLDRPHRFDVGVQRGPPDRSGPDTDRTRYRDGERAVVVAGRRRGAIVRRGLVLRIGIALRAELAACPGLASGCRARRRPSRARLRDRRTAA